MKRTLAGVLCLMAIAFGLCLVRVNVVEAQGPADWGQWGRTAQHSGESPAVGPSPNLQLADLTFDPFVMQEQAETFGELLVHYQAPLVDSSNVFLEYKTGTYVSCQPPGSGHPYPCGPDDWSVEIWNERAFVWQGTSLVEAWNFESDWKPEPNGAALGDGNRCSTLGWARVSFMFRDSPARSTS